MISSIPSARVRQPDYPQKRNRGDLDFLIHAGHGEFASAVFSPATIEQCFYLTIKAFQTADTYQIPVIVMTDRFPADSLHNVPPLDMGNIRVESKRISKSESKKINAYRLTENGISPKAIPSWITDVIYADRDEYTEAIRYKGFSPVDVLQPCVSVNKKNTYAWYSGRVYKVNDAGGYDEANIEHAFQKASEWGIPSDRSYLQERETDIRGVERTGEQGTAC